MHSFFLYLLSLCITLVFSFLLFPLLCFGSIYKEYLSFLFCLYFYFYCNSIQYIETRVEHLFFIQRWIPFWFGILCCALWNLACMFFLSRSCCILGLHGGSYQAPPPHSFMYILLSENLATSLVSPVFFFLEELSSLKQINGDITLSWHNLQRVILLTTPKKQN